VFILHSIISNFLRTHFHLGGLSLSKPMMKNAYRHWTLRTAAIWSSWRRRSYVQISWYCDFAVIELVICDVMLRIWS